MNEWVRKSIELADAPGYLDKLHEIYPMGQESERRIALEARMELKQTYNGGDDTALIKKLLRLSKFPFNDPYVAFLRRNKKSIEHNPQTVERIAKKIRYMGFEAMMAGISAPKVGSKQFGPLFKNWVSQIGFPMLQEVDLVGYNEGIAFLKGSDAQLKDFANEKLGCGLVKRPDFLARVRDDYVIGEAKFITETGGGQDRGFEDPLALLRGKKGKAIRIAVLDGVVWIKNRAEMHLTVCALEEPALTALLLKDFLGSLARK